MNLSSRVCCLFVACLLAVVVLPSCETYSDGGYYTDVTPMPYRSSNYGQYQGAPIYRDGRSGGNYGYNSSPYYDRGRSYDHGPNYRPYDYRDHHAHHDHDDYNDHRENSSRSSKSKDDDDLVHRPNSYRVAGGSTGSKEKPKGYHSVDWYKSRGYDVNKLKLQKETGEVYKKSSSSKKKRD